MASPCRITGTLCPCLVVSPSALSHNAPPPRSRARSAGGAGALGLKGRRTSDVRARALQRTVPVQRLLQREGGRAVHRMGLKDWRRVRRPVGEY